MPTIYLDADACPVKDLVFRTAVRYTLPLMVVANTPIHIPSDADQLARAIVVPGSPDAADDWIAEHATPTDLVLTADIPLAARIIEIGAPCLDFRGNHYNPNRIGEALASREINAMLRQMGEITGGPPAYNKNQRSAFASALDAAAHKLAKRRPL
ncbi:MAG: YaiI/YqxD family protein [Thermomicrobiales bacterium]|nr:YaiI/YqxD family protein [Thermomicrobiales bacterium]